MRRLAVCLAVALAVGEAKPAFAERRTERHLRLGARLFRQGEYQRALNRYKRARRHSKAPAILYWIGRCHLALEEWEAAAAAFRDYLALVKDARKRRRAQRYLTAALARLEPASQPAPEPAGEPVAEPATRPAAPLPEVELEEGEELGEEEPLGDQAIDADASVGLFGVFGLPGFASEGLNPFVAGSLSYTFGAPYVAVGLTLHWAPKAEAFGSTITAGGGYLFTDWFDVFTELTFGEEHPGVGLGDAVLSVGVNPGVSFYYGEWSLSLFANVTRVVDAPLWYLSPGLNLNRAL